VATGRKSAPSFRLNSSFAEAYPGTINESLAALRKEAFPKNDPGEAIKLVLREDKSILTGLFTGPESAIHQHRLAEVLARRDFWTRPTPPSPQAKLDPVAQRTAARTAEWVQALLQLNDPNRRMNTLGEILEALGSTDEQTKLAALRAIGGAHQVKFDRTEYRNRVLPLLADSSPAVRAAAVGSLLTLEPQPEHLDLVLPLVNDPDIEVRRTLPYAIKALARGDLSGNAGTAVLKLLEETVGNPDERPQLRMFLSSLWGSKYSPEIETKLVEMATPFTRETGYDVMYYSLSTQQNKGAGTVDVLLSCLTDRDTTNVVGRALWGLGYGVNPDQQDRVADAVLNYLQQRTFGVDRCLRILSQYGNATHADALESVMQQPDLQDGLKKQFESAITAIRQRK
jgi:hypothetical protein